MALPYYHASACLLPLHTPTLKARSGPLPPFDLPAAIRRISALEHIPIYESDYMETRTFKATDLLALHYVHRGNNLVTLAAPHEDFFLPDPPSAPSSTSSQPQSLGHEDCLGPCSSPITSPELEELPIPIFGAGDNIMIANPQPLYGYSHVPDIEAALEAFHPFRTSTPAFSSHHKSGSLGDLNTLEGVPGHIGIVAHGPRLAFSVGTGPEDDIRTYTVGVSAELRDDDNDEFYRPVAIRHADDLPKPIGCPQQDDKLGLGPVMDYLKKALFGADGGAVADAGANDGAEGEELNKAKHDLVQFIENITNEVCGALAVEKHLLGFILS